MIRAVGERGQAAGSPTVIPQARIADHGAAGFDTAQFNSTANPARVNESRMSS